MTKQTATATVTKAFGKDIPVLNISAEYDSFDTYAEVPENKRFSDAELLKLANRAQAQAALAVVRNAEFTRLGYKAPEVSEVDKLAAIIGKKHPEYDLAECIRRAELALA